MSIFFTSDPVTDYASAQSSNTDQYATYFNAYGTRYLYRTFTVRSLIGALITVWRSLSTPLIAPSRLRSSGSTRMTENENTSTYDCRTGSGGKTTLTAGILAALNNQGVDLQPFKAGPDFIDPQFHSHIVGKPSRNLDSWMMTPEMVRYLFCHNATGVDLALIEGVMGFYDGLLNEPLKGSSAELSVILKTPVILVINGKGMSLSVAAMIRGYMGLSPDVNIVGAILNQVREPIYKQLKPQVEEMTGVPLLGYLPPMPDIELKSRQLGLITPTEIVDLDAQIAKLAAQITESVDLQLLLNLAISTFLDHRVPEELVSALEWVQVRLCE